MKKFVLPSIVLIIMLFCLQAFAQPMIQIVDGKEFNFGHSKQQQHLKHTFVIKNAGTDTLHIISVKGG